MKVLHVLDTSVPDSAGYTTRGFYLVNNQKQMGVEPVVLTSERFRSNSGLLEDEIEGVNYYRTAPKTSFLRRLPILSIQDEINTLQKRISAVAAKEKIDLIHAHSPSLIGAACSGYCASHGIPLIYEIRAFWEDAAVDRGAFKEWSLMYRMRRSHETKVVKSADKVITICDGLHNDLLARGISPDKLHVVRNGVDHQRFQPLAKNSALQTRLGLNGKTVLGFIGSFFNFEGLQDIIMAMPEIGRQRKDIVLLLVGAGQVDSHLRNLVVENGLEEQVLFTGRVPHEEVDDYYSVIDILLYPRIKKRITELVTPLKPLEAMAMAKPVVMSDVGGLKELADAEGVAELYQAGNTRELAEKCLKLCSDADLCRTMGEKARQNVIDNWGWDKRAREDIEIYRNAGLVKSEVTNIQEHLEGS